MKKIITTILLGLLSHSSLAISPIPEHNNIIKDSQLIKNTESQLSLNDFPAEIQKWKPWFDYHKPNNCINGDSSKCFFYHKIELSESEKDFIAFKLIVSVDGKSDVELPKGFWVHDVKANNIKYPIIEKNNKPIINLKSGDYVITGKIDKKYEISYPQGIFLIENNIESKLSKPNKEEKKVSSFINFKVFRYLEDGIPQKLNTRIAINYSGEEKIVNLGKILPNNFNLINVNISNNLSNKNIHLNKENENFLINLKNGETIINIMSYSKFVNNEINVKNLLNNVNQEFWAVAQNQNFRTFNVSDAESVDPKKINSSYYNIPNYLVKDKINLQTITLNIESKSSITTRTSFLLSSSDSKFYITSYSNINNNYDNVLLFSDNNINEVKQNNNKKQILKIDNQLGFISDEGNSVLTINKTIPIKGIVNSFNLQDIKNIENVNSQEIELKIPPRYRLFNIENGNLAPSPITYNIFTENFNLYWFFIISIIGFGFYKLSNIKIAALAVTSMILFFKQSIFFYEFWIAILVCLGLLKVLKDGKFKNIIISLLSAISIVSILNSLFFIYEEFLVLIHPSLEAKSLDQSNIFSSIATLDIDRYFFLPFIFIFVFFTTYHLIKPKNITLQTTKTKKSYVAYIVLAVLAFILLNGIFTTGTKHSFQGNLSEPTDNMAIPAPMPASPMALAPPEAKKEMAMRSMNKANESVAPIELKEETSKENLRTQVSLSKPIFYSQNYIISPKSNNIKFYIASPLFVNFYAIIQIILVLILNYLIVVQLLLNSKNVYLEQLGNKIYNKKLKSIFEIKDIK